LNVVIERKESGSSAELLGFAQAFASSSHVPALDMLGFFLPVYIIRRTEQHMRRWLQL
jgi:hypothetical protein